MSADSQTDSVQAKQLITELSSNYLPDMNAGDLQNQLNIPSLDYNSYGTLGNLIDQSAEIIKRSVNTQVTDDVYLADPIYKRAVYTLATQLFYDRDGDNGMSNGLLMMLNHLQASYGGATNGS